jgi:hypothetical protein
MATTPDPEGEAIFMPTVTDPNLAALDAAQVRQLLKSNVSQYAATAYAQSIEIKGLQSLTDLDDAGQAEIVARQREFEVADAKRAAFQAALDGLPTAPADDVTSA